MTSVIGAAGVAPQWPERLFSGWRRFLPYALLAASLLLAGVTEGAARDPWARFGAALAGSAVAAGWTLLMLRRPAAGTPWSSRRLGVYFGVRLILTAGLVVINPWFGVYAWYGYAEAISYFALPLALIPIAGNALVVAASYLGGFPTDPVAAALYLLIVAGSTALVGGIGVSLQRTIAEQSERDRMMAEVVDANARLADALAENRGLQQQLVTQAREAGALDERARLAGEIHDTLAQALTGIVTQLEAAHSAGEISRGEPRHVSAAMALARSGLADARRSLHALRPERLAVSRLAEAITETAHEWSALSGVPVSVEVTGTIVALDADREIALLRAAQEGLANVAKHADASTVGLTLSYLDDEVLIDVRDDGRGFWPRQRAIGVGGHAVGLQTMRERVARVGGDLDIESEPGKGTALVVRVPRPAATGRGA